VGGLSRTLVDASAGQHRSSPPVTAVPELLHTEDWFVKFFLGPHRPN
jgi:hypothetical protein